MVLLIVNSNLQLIRMTRVPANEISGSGEMQRSCCAEGGWKSCGKRDDHDPVGAQGRDTPNGQTALSRPSRLGSQCR